MRKSLTPLAALLAGGLILTVGLVGGQTAQASTPPQLARSAPTVTAQTMPTLTVPSRVVSATLPVTVPLTVQVPNGYVVSYSHWTAFVVGQGAPPTDCTGGATSPPTSVQVSSYGVAVEIVVQFQIDDADDPILPTPACSSVNAVVTVADVTGSTNVVGVGKDGGLRVYQSNGHGGFSAPYVTGFGWSPYSAIVGVGNFRGEYYTGLVARDATGKLWLYRGLAGGGLRPRQLIGTGWNGMTAIVGVGDFNGDGYSDIVARDRTGKLWLYPSNGGGEFESRVQIGTGWNGMTAIVGVGDWNGDHHPDIFARDKQGDLLLYPGNGTGGSLSPPGLSSEWAGTR